LAARLSFDRALEDDFDDVLAFVDLFGFDLIPARFEDDLGLARLADLFMIPPVTLLRLPAMRLLHLCLRRRVKAGPSRALALSTG
jgi:hypothetical protein